VLGAVLVASGVDVDGALILATRLSDVFEQAMATARQQLGEEVFAAAWAEGGAMTLKQAADDALAGPEGEAAGEALQADAAARERFGGLTARERQVLSLVVAGRLNKQIAGELGVSEMTVKMHRRQVMRKMQATGVAQLVRLADQIGITVPLNS